MGPCWWGLSLQTGFEEQTTTLRRVFEIKNDGIGSSADGSSTVSSKSCLASPAGPIVTNLIPKDTLSKKCAGFRYSSFRKQEFGFDN